MSEENPTLKNAADKAMAFYAAASYEPEITWAFNKALQPARFKLIDDYMDLRVKEYGVFDAGQDVPELWKGKKAETNEELDALAVNKIAFVNDYLGVVSERIGQETLKNIWDVSQKYKPETTEQIQVYYQTKAPNLIRLMSV